MGCRVMGRRTSFLTDTNLLLLRQFHHLHAENRTKVILGNIKHMFELSTRARRHNYNKQSLSIHMFDPVCCPLLLFPHSSFPIVSHSRESRNIEHEPLAVISLRRMGWREYSLASARRTSFFTICSYTPPLPRRAAVISGVSCASAIESSRFSESVDGEGDCR